MDDSLRKKQWAAQPGAALPARNQENGPPVKRGLDEPFSFPDHSTGSVVPLKGSRKTRPKARVRKEGPPAKIEGHIGRQLKAVYDDVLNQPIPDRFLDLLSQLEEKTSGTTDGSGDGSGEK